MRPDNRLSYFRVLGRVMALVGRRSPFPLFAFVVVGLALMGANVLVFHLLEGVLSQLTDHERLSQLAGAILVAGSVIVLREVLEMVSDPIAAYVWGKTTAVLTGAMNQKVERLEVIDFETLDANERVELAQAGIVGALSTLMAFLFGCGSHIEEPCAQAARPCANSTGLSKAVISVRYVWDSNDQAAAKRPL